MEISKDLSAELDALFQTSSDNTAEGQTSSAQNNVQVLSGAWTEFKKGFKQAETDVDLAAQWLGAKIPQIAPYGKEGTGLITSGDEYYGEGFSSLPESARRAVIRADRQATVEDYYLGARTDTLAAKAGGFIGSMASPTSFIPAGAGVKGAMVSGAALGGTYGALEGLAHEGRVNPLKMVVDASIGAATAGVVEAAVIQPLGKLIDKYKSKGVPVPESEFLDEVGKVRSTLPPDHQTELDTLDYKKILSDANSTFGMDSSSPSLEKARVNIDSEFGMSVKDPSLINLDYRLGEAYRYLDTGSLPEVSLPTAISALPVDSKKPKISIVDDEGESALRDYISKKDSVIQELDEAIPEGSPLRNEIIFQYNAAKNKNKQFDRGYKRGVNYTTAEMIYDAIGENNFYWKGDIAQGIEPEVGMLSDFEINNPGFEKKIGSQLSKEWAIQRPSEAFKQWGESGKEAARLLEDHFENVNLKVADDIVDFSQAMIDAGIKSGDEVSDLQIRGLLNRTVSRKDASKEAIKAADWLEGKFKAWWKETYDSGKISKDKYEEGVARAREFGYFPRIWNKDKLFTTKGRTEFTEMLVNHVYRDLKQAEDTIRYIAGESSKKFDMYIKEVKKAPDGTYRLSKRAADSLYNSLGKHSQSTRAGHIEIARKLPESLEEQLTPFLVTDVPAVYSSYSQELRTATELTRLFGSKDEVAEKIYVDLAENIGQRQADSFWEVFQQSARDPKSYAAQSFIRRAEATRKVVGSIKSFETLKLLTSQTINTGQSIVGGTTYLAGRTAINPVNRYKAVLKGMFNTARSIKNKEMEEQFQRSGAAMQMTLSELAGGINEQYHSILSPFGVNKLPGVLDWINNPSKFLSATGFFAVEKFNRRMAYWMGRAYAEELVAKKSSLLAKGNRANPKDLIKVDKAFRELGIDPSTPLDQITLDHMQKAGQRVSNKVNFANAPHTVPIFFNSFYGKLIGQFKTFAFHHGAFVKDEVLKPAINFLKIPVDKLRKKEIPSNASLLPLMNYLAVGTPVGMGLREFKAWLMADDEKLSNTEKMLRGITQVGGMGIALDLAMRSYYGSGQAALALLGPGLSDILGVSAGVAKDIASSVDKEEIVARDTYKAFVKTLVFPGKKEYIESLAEDNAKFKMNMGDFEMPKFEMSK